MYKIKKVQERAIKIYTYFDGFCTEHNLRHFVIGGACIGAVRHKGFIPWDDDIDVFMPRPDYEKFKILWEKYGDKENYTYCRTNKTNNFKDAGSLLKDNNTTFINAHSINDDIHHGYMIDIIPIDGAAPTRFGRLMQKLYASVYSLFNVQRLPDNQNKVVRWASAIILFMVPFKKIRYYLWKFSEKRMSRYDFDNSEYITELVTGFKYMGLNYPYEIFSGHKQLDFENIKIKVPFKYKSYLTMAFGDFMKLPPIEARIPKHNIVFVDMEKSYKYYKGIYYCKDGEKL